MKPWQQGLLKKGENTAALIAFGFVALVAVGLYLDFFPPDTPQQHEQRLSCEQTQMLGGNLAGIRMSASDAEAFCDKLMQEQKIYDASHKP